MHSNILKSCSCSVKEISRQGHNGAHGDEHMCCNRAVNLRLDSSATNNYLIAIFQCGSVVAAAMICLASI